jgi:aryl-alcohol dehydrogenase-like predicted oxidoreductase
MKASEMMKLNQLGSSELTVTALGLGGNTFGPPRIDEATTCRVIHAALDAGVNFIDTAIGYGGGQSEIFIGNALRGRRDQAVVATKFNFRNLDRADPISRIRDHCETSLGKLQTDYIDLFQVHNPSDVLTTSDLIATLAELVQEGKIRAYGASNYSGWRLVESRAAAAALGVPGFASIQNQYSLLYRRPEQEQLQACRRSSASFIPFHPLGGGFLTGKYHPSQSAPPGTRGAAGSPIIKKMSTERNWQIVADLDSWARDRGHSVVELSLAWLTAQPDVGTVIAGVSNEQQLMQNIAGASWELTEAEVAAVSALSDTGENAPSEDYAAQVGRRCAA